MKSKEVVARLTEKFPADMSCPMCGNKSFSLVDGFFVNGVQEEINKVRLKGMSVPTVVLICKKCGFVSQHAIGAIAPEILKSVNEHD